MKKTFILKSIQAVILAGGKGTRLRPLTSEVPKPMIPIHGRPFLRYQLAMLKSFGIEDFLLLVGYRGEKIEKYFGAGSRFGLKINYSYEKELLGTGGALKKAADKLRKEFMLLNGDTLFPLNYRNMIEYFCRHRRIGVVTAGKSALGNIYNNMTVGKQGLVTAYAKKRPEGMTHVDGGVAIFRKEILDFIPVNKFCSLEEEIFPCLIEKRELLAYCSDKPFYDIGTFEGLKKIKEYLK